MKKKLLIFLIFIFFGCISCSKLKSEYKISSTLNDSSNSSVSNQRTSTIKQSSSEDYQESYVNDDWQKPDFITANGLFEIGTDTFTSVMKNSIILYNKVSVDLGTISSELLISDFGDNGLIFNGSFPDNPNNCWEGIGINYYFYFISKEGTAILGKTYNGTWSELGKKCISDYNPYCKYKLSVSFMNISGKSTIHCFLNNEHGFSVNDENGLNGNIVGIRCGSNGTEVSKLSINSEFTVPTEKTVGDYVISSGSFEIRDNTSLVALSNNSMCYSKEKLTNHFVISADLYQANSASDSGIIFGLERNETISFWEANVSYYFFFINIEGRPYLGKVVDGIWQEIKVGDKVSDFTYDVSNHNNLKIICNNNDIMCYVDDILHIEFNDNSKNDKKWVLTAGGNFYIVGELKCVLGNYYFQAETNKKIPYISTEKGNVTWDCEGAAYATVSFFNDKYNRRIMVSWMIDKTADYYSDKIWNGCMSSFMDTKLKTINDELVLVSYPIEEYSILRTDKIVELSDIKLSTENVLEGVRTNCFDMEIEFDENSENVEFQFCVNENNSSKIIYNGLTKEVTLDLSNSGDHVNSILKSQIKSNNETIKLKIVVDVSLVEIYVNEGEIVIQSLFFANNCDSEIVLKGKDANIRNVIIYKMSSSWSDNK